MLTEQFKNDYQAILKACGSRLFRHPQRNSAERLQALIPLANQYSQADVYGQGGLVSEFEAEIAIMLGQDEAIFLPSGTMAQNMALRIWADDKNNNKVAFHPSSHLQLHEKNAYQELHGLQSVLLGQDAKVITLADIEAINTNIAALLIELPMREIGGQLPSWVQLQSQSAWARQQNVAFHLDGARLWSCESYYQKSLSEIASLFDSVYVSFYKDLDGIAGAVLAGSKCFIDKARIWSRRCGGNLITQFPDVLAAKTGLNKHLPLMPEYVAKARQIAEYFNQQDNIRVIPPLPPCNLFHLVIQQTDSELMPKVAKWCQQNDIALLPQPRTCNKNDSRFEVTIGQNGMALSNEQWKVVIKSFAHFIR
jgi:threonine aldolase